MEVGTLGQCPEEGNTSQVGFGEVGLPQLPLGVCILCEVLVGEVLIVVRCAQACRQSDICLDSSVAFSRRIPSL